jgi:hypothetical protein
MLTGKFVVSGCFGAILGVLAGPALAQNSQGGGGGCGSLPSWQMLKTALQGAVGVTGNGGLGNNMWGTIVDNSGVVCAVAFSGANFTSQWLGSRVISAQKANTGNAFSLGVGAGGTVIALSSANLYSAVQPGGSLYGLQASNPVETDVAYGNSAGGQGNAPASGSSFGTTSDPLVGHRVGGINVFGGASRSIKVASEWAASELAATRPAPITWSLGERATRWDSISSERGSAECLVLPGTRTISFLTLRQIRTSRVARARFPTRPETSGTAQADLAIRRASTLRLFRPCRRCADLGDGDGTGPSLLSSPRCLSDARRRVLVASACQVS